MGGRVRAGVRRVIVMFAFGVGCTLVSTGTSAGQTLTPSDDPSPAGCRIESLANPHFAQSVPGAVKVNAKAQCNTAVSEQTLTVTMLVDGEPVHRTETKASNKAFLWNQGTFLVCTNFIRKHTFQGAALGVSWEGGKPFLQTRLGPVVELPCDV